MPLKRNFAHISRFELLRNCRSWCEEGHCCCYITGSDDVAFYWCMLCTEAEEEENEELLARIVDLWVTIRGFSFVRSWMEMFKQASKKGTQRAKALRKDLH